MSNANVSTLIPLLVALSTGLVDASVADENRPPQLLPCSRALASPAQAWSPPPAAKQLANLDAGPPRTVRLIYFLPNDRPYDAEVVNRMKTTMRQVQTFYAEQMQAHGYGDRTFRLETDAAGEPKVHRVDGQYPESYYIDKSFRVLNEISQAYNLHANIYFIIVDSSSVLGGAGLRSSKNSGYALLPSRRMKVTVHELGHAFGLYHDFRDGAYIMSYSPGEWDRLSACNAGILSVHPHFTYAVSSRTSSAQRPTIELLSSREYPPGSNSASVQLRVRDSEGLRQVTLYVHTRKPHSAAGHREVKACRGLGGKTRAVVEFDYDGVVPSAPLTTGLSMSVAHSFKVEAFDKNGNAGFDGFTLVETPSHRIATLEGEHQRRGHGVISVAFSSDGQTLAAGGNIVELWDMDTKKSIATLEVTAEYFYISSVAFAPDGQTLAAAFQDGTISLWDVGTKMKIATLEGHKKYRNISVAFSPDGQTLASESQNGAVKLWDVSTKTEIATLAGPQLPDNAISLLFWPTVAFAPDGQTLATGAVYRTKGRHPAVTLWDVDRKKRIATLDDQSEFGVFSVAFSPDGQTLAVGRLDRVQVWDVDRRKRIASFEASGEVRSVAFAPDGQTLAAAERRTTVRLWDVDTKTKIATFAVAGSVYSMVFAPDGQTLVTGVSATVQLWDTSEWTGSRLHSQVETSSDEQQETGQETEQETEQETTTASQTLTMVSGDGQEGPASTQLSEPLAVSGVDQNGSPLAGVDVTFAVTAGGGMLSSTTDTNPCIFKSSKSSLTATTDATGQAATRLTLGSQPGTNTVEVTGEGLEPITFTATAAEQATPHRLTKVCGDDQEGTAGERLAQPLVVSVVDEDGAAIAEVDVSFAITAGGGTLSAATATTNATGRARTYLTLGSELGTNTVEATVEGLESETFTATGQESPLAGFFDFFGGGKLVALPDSPQLAQNAPNPFNSQTVLAYFLHAPGPARVEVFALSGQRVAVLHQGPQQAGFHRLRWDGRDDAGRSVASGVYLYRLVTDETVLTRKLILLR